MRPSPKFSYFSLLYGQFAAKFKLTSHNLAGSAQFVNAAYNPFLDPPDP